MATSTKQKNRHCAECGAWFRIDPRVGDRQRTCGAASCRKDRRARTLRRARERDPDYWRRRRLKERLQIEQRKGSRPVQVAALPLGKGEILLVSQQDPIKPEILAVVGLQLQKRVPSKQDSINVKKRVMTGSVGQNFSIPKQDPKDIYPGSTHNSCCRRQAEGS